MVQLSFILQPSAFILALLINLSTLNQLARDLAQARRVFGLAQAALRPRLRRFFRVEQLRESSVEKNRRLLVKASYVAAQLKPILVGQPYVQKNQGKLTCARERQPFVSRLRACHRKAFALQTELDEIARVRSVLYKKYLPRSIN